MPLWIEERGTVVPCGIYNQWVVYRQIPAVGAIIQ